MPQSASNYADFKGLLLQSHNRPGQRYALLLFRTKDGLRFCLCKNLKLVRMLRIGNSYRVRGQERTFGHKTYLNIVSAELVGARTARFKKRVGLMASAASMLIIVGLASAGFVSHQDSQRDSRSDGSADVELEGEVDSNTPGKRKGISNIINDQKQDGGAVPNNKPSQSTQSADGDTNEPESAPEDPAADPPIDPTPSPAPEPTPPPEPEPEPAPEPTPPPPTPPPEPELVPPSDEGGASGE